MTPAPAPLLVTIAEAARLLSMSPDWVEREITAGRLRSQKLGRSRRLLRADVVRLAEERDDARVVPVAHGRRQRRKLRAVMPASTIPADRLPFPEMARAGGEGS